MPKRNEPGSEREREVMPNTSQRPITSTLSGSQAFANQSFLVPIFNRRKLEARKRCATGMVEDKGCHFYKQDWEKHLAAFLGLLAEPAQSSRATYSPHMTPFPRTSGGPMRLSMTSPTTLSSEQAHIKHTQREMRTKAHGRSA